MKVRDRVLAVVQWGWILAFWVMAIGAIITVLWALEPTPEQLAQEDKEMLATLKGGM
jgi:predicted MFS family arabinose efflux permease